MEKEDSNVEPHSLYDKPTSNAASNPTYGVVGSGEHSHSSNIYEPTQWETTQHER